MAANFTDSLVWDWFWMIAVILLGMTMIIRNRNNERYLALSILAALFFVAAAITVIVLTA